MMAGHSLGEFTALAASGALSFEDALRLVSKRAQAMQKAVSYTHLEASRPIGKGILLKVGGRIGQKCLYTLRDISDACSVQCRYG